MNILFRNLRSPFIKLTVKPPFELCPLVVALAGYVVFPAPIPGFFDGDNLWFVFPPTRWSRDVCRFNIFASMLKNFQLSIVS